ncbi:MAG: polysaccharide biosynthesis tyrosine autokinase [Candidatus Abyssubacteria bacterium]
MNAGPHLKDYLRIISVRRWIFLCTFLSILLAVTVWVFVRTPIYRAESLLLIEPVKVNLTEFKAVYDPTLGEAGGHLANQEFLETQYNLIVSRPLLEQAFEKFGYGSMPEFKDEEEPIKKFAKLFRVIPVRRSRLATVTFEWEDPELAAKTLDFLVNEYIADYRKRALGVTREGLSALRQKAEELRPQVEAKANELQQFRVDHNMVSLEETQNIVVERLKDISKNLTEVERVRIEVESDYLSIERALSGEFQMENLPEIASSETIRDLKLEYIRTKQRHSDLGKSFGPNHPEVKAVQAILDAIKEKTEAEMISILKTVKAEYERAVSQEKQLRDELRKQEEKVMQFNKLAVQYKALMDDHDTLRRTYNAVAKRIEEIEIATAAGSKGDNIFIISPPRIPTKPIRPRKALSVAIAVVFGLSLGTGLCFLIDYLDTTVKTKEDVEALTGVPVIGYVPGVENGHAANENHAGLPIELYLLREPRSPVAEAFRSIRTAIAFSSNNGDLKHLIVTSSDRSEGKSMSSINISVVMAQAGKKVLLVDADLRRPRLHKVFGVEPSPGLSNLLVGEGVTSLEEAVQAVEGVDNLYLLPCGPMPPNPAELLQSSRMQQLLEEMGRRFDITILDTPPLVSVTDAAVLCQYVKNVVMIVRSFSTQREIIARAREIISETNSKVLGMVLNNVDVPRGDYHGYYYGYHYGYREDDAKEAKRERTATGRRRRRIPAGSNRSKT